MKPEMIREPKFVMINDIDGSIHFYPLNNTFTLFRGDDADFVISVKEDKGILSKSDEFIILEEEYSRLEALFASHSSPIIMMRDD